MIGYIIVIGILFFIGIFALGFFGGVLDWIREEYPILGGIISCILFVAIVYGVIWFFVNIGF